MESNKIASTKETIQEAYREEAAIRKDENIKIGVHSLIEDLLEVIFSHLSIKSLLRCQRVCKRWKTVGNKDLLWKVTCTFRSDQYLGTLC